MGINLETDSKLFQIETKSFLYNATDVLFLPEQDSDGVDNVVGMAGLSQRDLVLSQRAEAQLEQQKRDQELARRLQGQLELGSYFTKTTYCYFSR